MADNTTDTSATVESAESVQQSTSEILQKHKRGRPKGSRNRPREVGGEGEADRPAPLDPATVQVSLGLVKKTAEAVVAGIDAMVCRSVANRVRRMGGSKEFVEDVWRNTGITKDEVSVISECTSTIVSRHEILLRYAPEIMLACALTTWGVRIITVMKKLDGLEMKLAKEKREANAPLTEMPNESRA